MRNKYELVAIGSIIALCGFGPCERVDLNRDGSPPDAPTQGNSLESSATLGTEFCYYASGRDCRVGPCSITTSGAPTCTIGLSPTEFVDYMIHGTLYGVRPDGSAAAMYPDPATSVPVCHDQAILDSEPNAGAYWNTGAETGTYADIGMWCDQPAPVYSAAQCYFTSFPQGSNHCVTGPCQVTNVATAVQTCAVGAPGAGPLYVYFAQGKTIYATDDSGTIISVYQNAATDIPACTGGAFLNSPFVSGDYYGTSLPVGSPPAEVALFCSP